MGGWAAGFARVCAKTFVLQLLRASCGPGTGSTGLCPRRIGFLNLAIPIKYLKVWPPLALEV